MISLIGLTLSLLFIAFLLALRGNCSPGLKLESPEMTSFQTPASDLMAIASYDQKA